MNAAPAAAGPLVALQISAFDPAHDKLRDELVQASAKGSVFHLAGWRRAIERVFEHEARDLVAWRGSEMVGVLPLFLCRSPLGQKHLISIPYAVYGGPIGQSLEVERALVDAAVALAREERVGRLELRCFDDTGLEHLVRSELYATFIQALPGSAQAVWTSLPKRFRAEVRKSIEKHGLALSQGAWYSGDLTDLFQLSKQSLGSPGLPRRWFDMLLKELPGHAFVHVARQSAQPVAASMSFVFGGSFSFYYIGVAPGANRELGATDFMTARLMEWAAERGLKEFDLGRSRVDSGPYLYKKNKGFEPRALPYRYELVRSRALPSFNPSNPKTAKLREAWAKLPTWASKRLSGAMMRYLP